MLVKLELQELKERRTSQKLIFLYKVVEGLVPSTEPDDYLKKDVPRDLSLLKKFRTTRQKTSEEQYIPSSKTHQFSNSFFVKSLIDWNHLEDSVVCATNVESFKSALTNHQ